MSFTYRVDHAARRVTFTASTTLTVADFIEVFEAALENPEFDPTYGRLWDVRPALDPLDGRQVRAIAAQYAARIEPRLTAGRSALLVGSDVYYGLSRMFAGLSEAARVEFRVFRDEAEAVAWLDELGERAATGGG
ncbi:MAG: hypothetical protein D6701_02760 [Gemmatimonadetes bacterium]|nr:MAG: hypothetical protein D6701_02760 [Gemmatimonadota bacterium]